MSIASSIIPIKIFCVIPDVKGYIASFLSTSFTLTLLLFNFIYEGLTICNILFFLTFDVTCILSLINIDFDIYGALNHTTSNTSPSSSLIKALIIFLALKILTFRSITIPLTIAFSPSFNVEIFFSLALFSYALGKKYIKSFKVYIPSLFNAFILFL